MYVGVVGGGAPCDGPRALRGVWWHTGHCEVRDSQVCKLFIYKMRISHFTVSLKANLKPLCHASWATPTLLF